MKKLLLSIALLQCCFFSQGTEVAIPNLSQVGASALTDTILPVQNAPFDIIAFAKPVFPNVKINIAKKGAKQGVLVTRIINSSIDELSKKGGGIVVIPAGKWLSGRIVLKSNVNLHLEKGAELIFSDAVKDYLPAVFTRHEGVEVMGPGAFIYANGQSNIAVTGKGTISGPALDSPIRKLAISEEVVDNSVSNNTSIEKRIFDGINGRRLYVPKTISPINCKNVYIEGVSIKQSLFWNVCPVYCENVIIRGITVNSVGIPSGDGIDLESCKNVLIEYCTLSCGDDCFTLKAGRGEDGLRVGKPTENVIIRYSLAQNGHGAITCGSETAGGIKNVYAYDCVFDNVERGCRFKTRRSRGGVTEKIYFERIRMTNVMEAFTWDLLGSPKYVGDLALRYPLREITPLTPTVKDIYIKNFIVESSKFLINANCIPEVPLSNVIIENGEVKCNDIIGSMADVTGFVLRNVNVNTENSTMKIMDGKNILFDDVRITVLNQTKTKK